MSDSIEQGEVQQQEEKRKHKNREKPPKKKKFLVKKGRSVDNPDWKSIQKPKKKHYDDVVKTNNDVTASNNVNDVTQNDATSNSGQIGNVTFEEVDSENADSQSGATDDVSVTQQYLVSEVDDVSTVVGEREEWGSYLSDDTMTEEQMSMSDEQTKGRDVSYLTPYMEHALKMSQTQSQVEYRRDMKRLQGQYNLDVSLPDLPEVKIAKKAGMLASNNVYRKDLENVREKFKGFQKLEYKDSPEAKRGEKAAILSDKAYKEEWEYDKGVICFPATLTKGYDAMTSAQRNASSNIYKEDLPKTLENVHFDPTKTNLYKTIQDNLKYTSSKEYKEGYEKNKHKYTPVPFTADMVRYKALNNFTNWNSYTAYARKLWEKYHLVVPIPLIAQAVETAKVTSEKWYKADYKTECVGKSGPADIVNYPLLQQARKAGGLASNIAYRKEADKAKMKYTVTTDSPDFIRAKTASDSSYNKYVKQKANVIANYQGYQKMDPSLHPIVQRANMAAALSDNKAYVKDWEYDKQNVYYPVHITPGYEASADVKKVQSDSSYKQEFEKLKSKNRFDVTDTQNYGDIKNNMTDLKYKEQHRKNQGHVTQIPETHEMVLSKELRPIQSKKQYTEKSKEMQKNVNVGSDIQEISHAVDSQKQSSSNAYKAHYKQNIVGKPPNDPTTAYPEHDLHKKMTQLNSSPEYTKEASVLQRTNQLPVDSPQFTQPKTAAQIASNVEYKKHKQDVIDNYRGFQTMQPKDHPVVLQANKASELNSEKAYHEDWEYDKQNVCYPVHITPGYEASADVQKVQSDVTYKKEFEVMKEKNRFQPTDTEQYKELKQLHDTASNLKYKEDYEKNKGRNQTNVPETPEMVLSKELRPIQSKKQYTEKSKEMQKNVNVGSDLQELSTAVNVQKMSSDKVYKADYDKNMVGKAPADIAKAYPEYDLLRQVSKQNSKAEYQKEAEKMMHTHNLPLDYPEFVRAKRTAINASDRHYQKQKQEVIDNYKGFQTMDSSDHPIVQQGIKAAELASKTAYVEDWEYDKQNVYYPVHITPGYEASADIQKVQSDVQYKQNFEKNKDKNNFDVTSTENYKSMQENDKTKSEVKYKEEYEKNKGRNQTNVPETPEMVLSKELRPIQSKKQYTEKSKEMQKNVNVGSDLQELSTAVNVQKMSSDKVYKADYDKNMMGKAPADIAKAYPEYDLLRQVSKQNSKAEYQKDAEKMMHTHNLPLDYPEFVRAKRTAINASDRHYQKQRQEVIDNYKGFQTMDSNDHPIVQQGIKAAELASKTAYVEDWEYDKQNVYYPVHITPGYEASADIQKVQSDVQYKQNFEKNKDKNNFDVTSTENYKSMQENDKTKSEVKYKEEYEKNKGRNQTNVPETHEMVLSKELRPIQSKKQYTEKSKEMQKNVNVGSDLQELSTAVNVQKMSSDKVYKADYDKNMVGKAPADIAKAYPEYDLLRQVSKQNSKAEYQKEAEKMMHTHNLPLDYPEFVRAKRTAINASDRHYQKQRQEVIDNYKGFQTMDSSDHPVVQRGIKAAELMSDKLYKEDWEYIKPLVYYPVHITPGYEQALDASKFQSQVQYTKDGKVTKAKNNFTFTDTEQYQTAKQLLDLVSDKKYTESHVENLGKGFHPLEVTPEMALSNSLKPLLSEKNYTQDAKKIMQKYNLDSTSTQGIAHALGATKATSQHGYVKDFKANVLGKAPADLKNSYPEYDRARAVTKMGSKAEYQKEAEKMMHTHNLPLDYPEFVRAKRTAINASDRHYQKQRQEVIDNYKGFQNMDSKVHPVVQHGIKAAELISDKAYREDWEYDKQNIYFPAHITPGYEAAVDASKASSNNVYTKKHEQTKASNRFNMTDTETYKANKDVSDLVSDKKYHEAYEASKGKNPSQIEETPEMTISKSLKPLLSNKLYGDDARRKMKEYNLDTSMQAIAQALSVQKLADNQLYTSDFRKNVVGSGPADISLSYPEYDHARNVSKLTSKALYWKDAEKMMHTHNLPLDYPEFVRAKQNAKNASDAEYRKQRKEVIDKYRGFQTMDSDNHPIVQQGIRAADLISERKYKEDYMADKDIIYYPVHLTPGYESAMKAGEIQSETTYKKKHNKEGSKNNYLFTETESYTGKKNMEALKDHVYKGEYARNFTAIPITPEMEASNLVKGLISHATYTKEAKKRLDVYNIDLNDQRVAHALDATKISSGNMYTKKFKKDILGKSPHDITIAHPEYELARQVSKMNSKSEYVKEADKLMHHHNIPLDYPEFIRARECAKNASDAEYRKQRKEVIDKYRGFQTMDSDNHPIVQQGIKAANLISTHKYIEDYMIDRSIIYYPVHLTPGYEAATKANQYQSELKYKQGYNKMKGELRYNPTITDQYKSAKSNQGLLNDDLYKASGRELKFSAMEETPEMQIAKSLKPLKPSEYQKTAKDLLQKYHLNVELPEITHAVCVTQLQSRNKYLQDYNENIKGKVPADLVNSYPEYIHARNVSKNTSKAEYTKTGEEMRHHFTIPLDTPELNRAKEASKNASDQLYKKQRKEVIDSYRGFQTMDSNDHPIVQQGIKAAELISDKKYKEDYMDERDMIYYPVHLTPGYEAASKSSEQSDVKYTKKHKKEKALNKFNPVETDSYEQSKAQQTALMDKNYKKGIDDLSFTPITDSIDQTHLKEMRKLMNNKKYTDDAKKTLDKYNINADVIQIAHALVTTPLNSEAQYRKDYQSKVKGKGVSGTGIEFYPDYVKAKDNSKLSSKSEYSKDNEKMIHHYTMPVDTPDLNRAKESAINASDLHYKKQRKEVIDSYRGFQTMDSKNHPIVQQGIKAADLMSERKYKEDYMEDRNIIYYPVHLTPGYESATKASQYINGPSYKKAYNKTRNDFQYDVTKTEGYNNAKDLGKLCDSVYKTDPSTLPFTQNKDGPDMERARMVKPLVSYWFYKDQAKKMLDKYHIDLSDQRMVQAIQSNKLTSEIKYRKDYEKDVKGKMKNESIEAYPEYKHALEVGKNTSQSAYTKESAKDMNNYTIPVDHPFITHAKQVDENVSQIAYTKHRQEVIDKYRGFQTMDSKNHPIVQHGIKAADLISERKYKEDYMEDRNLIYYPVHLTAGYEAATKSSKFASDADYKRWYNRNIKGCGNFPANLSPGYEVNKKAQELLSNNAYKKKYEETKSEFTAVPNIIEMRNVKEVQPLLSQKKYKKDAQELMGKYHLDAAVPEIAHALFVTNVLSPAIYKKKYEEEVKGKGAEHLEKSPYITQLLKASKLASKAGYGRKAQEDMHLYRLGLDTAEIQQAIIADKLTSDVTYKKGASQAKEDCKGYFKLPTEQIPTYKHLKNVAENMSDIKYKEEYNDMKKYIYFPYHITPEYEKKLEASKLLNPAIYAKNHKVLMAKSNFKYHEIPEYLANKELQSMLDVHKDKKALEELHQHGYNNANDIQSKHILDVQKRLSNNLYKLAAKEVMDKYNITAELPEIKQALVSSKLASHNKYKEGYKTGKGMDYDPEIPSYQLARNVKALNSENLYKNEAHQALRTYQVITDDPNISHAKTVTQNASNVEYKKKGAEILSKVKGYQHLKAGEQREVAHARKVNDIFSPAKYKEEYNEIRNLIYFPVHLTDGYECVLKANKFASPANYKREFYKSRFFNRFKVHETEGYQLDRAVQQMISNITYRAAYNKDLGKCPYITETPERGHHRDMKNLFSENRYRNDAKGIMSKYNLITDEPRMVNAINAVKLASENRYKEDYEKNKGKPTHNIHETPTMKQAMLSSKLVSEKPYKQEALKELQSVRMPEDTTGIKHAQEVGVMMSDIVYKKDAKENSLQGYNRVSMKDNYVLRHLDGIKDIASEVHYKQDLFDQRGQSIPVVDTPINVRVQKQQKLQSDKFYKKDLEKHIKGHGLSSETTPQIEHAKDMAVLYSERKYKEGTKDLHEWKSGEAINTPTAVQAKQTNDITSDYKYREEYEKNKGQGCNVITPAIAHAKDVSKNVSDISYKEKHVEDGLTPPSFTVLPSTPRIEHVQETGRNQSDIKYKEQHINEDIGKSAELKDAVLIKSNVKTTELQSNIEYKKQGSKVVEDYKAYFNCINDTPTVKHARKAKDILSTFKYKEAYENEKGIFFYPYFLTPQYEAQVKAGKLQSQSVYKKKAEKEKHIFHLTTDQPNFRHAREALDLCSDLKYRQPYQGKAAKLRDSRDVPSILHSKKMQDLLSDKRYKSKYEEIKDKYHLDVVTPTMANAKNASKIISDVSYKEKHNQEKGNAYNGIQDSLEMKHLRSLPDQFSDNKYKQDLIISRGKVIQVADTPWLTGYKQAQQFISHIKYGQNSGKKLKCRYQPDKFNKHVKNVTENISDSKYHDDYEQYFKGNLIPLPLTPEVENVIKNSKLISSSAYKKKAKEGLNHYLIIPDDPEYKRLKDVHTNLSEISYKEDAGKKMGEFTSVLDTPALVKAKENMKLQSESAYKSESKKTMQTGYSLPQEGTSVMQQQLYATTLTSDKTYKDRGDEIKHEPTGYKHMKETMETKHAKEMNKTHSNIKYKEIAKKGLQHVHPTASDPWTDKAIETNNYISDINYKAKDKDLAHAYKAKETDNFTKHAMNVTNHISDAKYKADYIENVGLCWFRPNERVFEHARKVADLSSNNKYKQEAMKMKGKYHITTDTPEFERLRKVQSDVSESKYKGESGVDQSQDFTVLEITPEIKHATQVSSLVSKNKYKEAFNKNKGAYTVLKNEPVVQHAQQVQKMQSKVESSREVKKMPKAKFTSLATRKDTDHLQQVQRNVSNTEYTKEARENIDKDFTVTESRPDVEHAIKTNKLQSDVHYRQKLKGKNISKTPAMKSAMDANKLQSNLEYRKEFDKEIKGKGWKFIKDTPAQKHAEEIGKVQSQYKYTQKHRNEKMKGYTSITDRPDILHATSCKDVVSDYEYKRRHRNMAGKGYTFTPNTPGQVHAEEATHLQSELQYRRKFGNTGKSWQSEESPFIGHYKEAQKLVDNIDYRKNAKELNARGTGAMESTPAMEHHKKAQQILDGRAYRADYERTVKGRGMTFDLHGTPAMDHIKHAEDIKSDKLYKESYEAMKGRPTSVMDAPHIVNAQKATALISDVKYKQDYNDSRGRMCSMLDTPEMKRVRENQKNLSQNNYKSDVEMSRGRNSAILDTPELRRVRQNTKNMSSVTYKDTNESRPMNVLDTPAFRTAKQNSMNFSQIKYKEDHENMRGKATSVVDTPTLRTVRQNSRNVSDIAYKGALKKTEEMEKMRANVVQPINKVQKTTKIHFNETKNTSGSVFKPEPPHEVVRSAPMRRWRRNPGSIFDYDPSEYETDTEYEEGVKRPFSRSNIQTDEDEDYKRLQTIDPKTFVNKTVPWTDYVLGSGHRHVGAPNSVYDYNKKVVNGSSPAKVQYRAMYDYNAADGDEITFVDGDVIIDAQLIDEGWMFGTCLRTGETGMIPANYVKTVA